MRTNGSPNLSSMVALNDAAPDPQIDLYVELKAAPQIDDHLDRAALQSSIDCTIQLTGATTWESDLLVIASPAGPGQSGIFSRATAYILPENVLPGGILAAKLTYLQPGLYDVGVFQLGETNSEPLVRIGGINSPVELVLPPQGYLSNNSGDRFYFQDPPQKSVGFDLNLADGT